MANEVTQTFVVRSQNEIASSDFARVISEWLERNGPHGIFRTCSSCTMMRRDGPAFCERYQMTPPMRVIERGCDQHEDEAKIPF